MIDHKNLQAGHSKIFINLKPKFQKAKTIKLPKKLSQMLFDNLGYKFFNGNTIKPFKIPPMTCCPQ